MIDMSVPNAIESKLYERAVSDNKKIISDAKKLGVTKEGLITTLMAGLATAALSDLMCKHELSNILKLTAESVLECNVPCDMHLKDK